MPKYDKGQIMTPVFPLHLAQVDSPVRTREYRSGDILLLVKYKPRYDAKTKKDMKDQFIFTFLDADGRLVRGIVWVDHLRTLQDFLDYGKAST